MMWLIPCAFYYIPFPGLLWAFQSFSTSVACTGSILADLLAPPNLGCYSCRCNRQWEWQHILGFKTSFQTLGHGQLQACRSALHPLQCREHFRLSTLHDGIGTNGFVPAWWSVPHLALLISIRACTQLATIPNTTEKPRRYCHSQCLWGLQTSKIRWCQKIDQYCLCHNHNKQLGVLLECIRLKNGFHQTCQNVLQAVIGNNDWLLDSCMLASL